MHVAHLISNANQMTHDRQQCNSRRINKEEEEEEGKVIQEEEEEKERRGTRG